MDYRRKIAACLAFFLPALFFGGSLFAQMQFIENKGQWDKSINYKSDFSTGNFFLQPKGFTVLMYHPEDLEVFSDRMHGHLNHDSSKAKAAAPVLSNDRLTLRSHVYKVEFIGASNLAQAVPDKLQPEYNNYFIGDDKSKWQGNCRIFNAVTYKNIYPNIDVRYYSDAGTLKYDLVVHPGGNINDIALKYDGATKVEVKNKELVIGTSVGDVKELYPYTYQYDKVGRQMLDCKYVVKDNVVRFKVKDASPDATVIIDPTLIFCSFSGSTADNWGYTATYGPDGGFFAGGISFGPGFTTTPGAYQASYAGGTDEDGNGPYDIFITKFTANGSRRVYGTYLGGGGNEQPHSMVCDLQGNLVVAGRSNSNPSGTGTAYPTTVPLIGDGGKYDIVVTKFNATGTDIIGSVKIGGSEDDGVNIKPKYVPVNPPAQTDGAFETRRNYGDDARSEVILDGANNIYLASSTQSGPPVATNSFPIRSTGIQTTFGGKQDGVILKFSPNLNNLTFSSFLGGSGNDACFVLTLNPVNGDLYVAGATTSSNLPGNTSGSVETVYKGGVTDGFVTRVKADGSAIVKTTYIGTTGNDLVYGIQCDKFGFPYITGTTTGLWPVRNAAFSNNGGKQFICKLQADLSDYVYSTMFGTNSASPNISITAFLVDRCQNVYVSGWGGNFNNGRGYPCAGTAGLTTTPGAIQSSTDGNDFYFFVLERNATSQLFGSFFGQNGGFDDHVDGGTSRFDANGIIYQAICANCGGRGQPQVRFPTTPGVVYPSNISVSCSQASVKIEMNFSGIGASVRATIGGVVDTVGCVPLTIQFTDTLAKGKTYIWDYGDPFNTRKDTTYAPNNSVSHTYTRVGSYRLMLVSIDSSTCNIADTAYVTVKVGNNEVRPDFTFAKIGGCGSSTYEFRNTTTAVLPNFKPNTFTWDFGDNTPIVRGGTENQTHTYASPGTYLVTLTVDDTTFCNAPADTTKPLRLAVNVDARFETPARGCVPYTAEFKNTSLGGTDFVWDFGDGQTSTDGSPTITHTYNRVGNYTIRLTAVDTSTCNKTDDFVFSIEVFPIPTPAFDYSPKPARENTPTAFSNFSQGATSYKWDFGDGDTSNLRDPLHQFNSTGKFNVCLIAFNTAGCSDTTCTEVEAKVIPLLDVPNAFTPGRGSDHGISGNGVIKVMGFGVGKMSWRIYNRWGQLMFQSNSLQQGWDGTFKGSLQPMDVYTYTLDVEFSDGQKLRKTGDITLLR